MSIVAEKVGETGTSAPKQAPHMRLPLWKKVLFSATLLVIVVTVLELTAALYLKAFRGYDGEHLLQYEFDPYKNILPTPNFVDTRGVAHNSQGFRHPMDVPYAKAPGTLRVFLMGASTAYGTGGLWPHLQRDFEVLHDSTTISAYLQQELDRLVPNAKVEVVNAAIPSIWTHHHLIYLNQQILRFDPDLVIFLDGFNDFFINSSDHHQFASYAYKEHAHVIMGEPTLKALAYANVWWASRRSAFAHVFFRQLQNVGRIAAGRAERATMDADASFATLQRVFPRNALPMIERTALILTHEDVDALFILQPLLITERDRPGAPEMEQRLFEFNVSSHHEGYEAFMLRAAPWVSGEVERAVTSLGASFFNANRMFSGVEGQVYTDYAHLTPLGNRMLAARIATVVTPQLTARVGGDELASR